MKEQDEDDRNVCTECIGAKLFKAWIRDNGERGQCGFNTEHGDANHVMPVFVFAEEVDTYFRENYGRGEEYPYFQGESDRPSYDTYGEPYTDILSNDLECDDDVVTAVVEHLPDASPYDIMQGDEAFYDDTVNYESFAKARQRADDYWFESPVQLQWQEFCASVQFERRFFRIKEPLDDLFGKAEEYEVGDVRPIYDLPVGQKVYRARLIDDDAKRAALRSTPATELGAPPKEKTRDGRMNVEFIPAFYGAFSKETAIAEIRPGIGEEIAIGVFELKKKLKVFDFTVFAEERRKGGDPAPEHSRADFIQEMEAEISKPVLPYDRQREYIPTQIVAEYLKEHFGCDAVIYRSSMIKEHDKESRNIVILNRGENLVGYDSAPLAYRTHTTDRVDNVKYEMDSELPF